MTYLEIQIELAISLSLQIEPSPEYKEWAQNWGDLESKAPAPIWAIETGAAFHAIRAVDCYLDGQPNKKTLDATFESCADSVSKGATITGFLNPPETTKV